MEGKKRLTRTYLAICCALTVFAIYISLKVAPLIDSGDFLTIFEHTLDSLKTAPFKITICDYSLTAALYTSIGCVLITLVVLINVKNYRYGEEHGSARWGNPRKLTKQYASKDNNNLLVSSNVKMAFDDRITGLNSNVTLVGGPGSGKTLKFVIPNVLNAACSMVITDPKGSTLKSCGKALKEDGYKVRVLDLWHCENSWGYNPFVYIRNEDDIFRMVELIFEANTPKNSMTQEPFFDDNAKFLFLACCYYLYFKAPENEQNLPFVLEMLNFLEIRDDDLNYISPFDELFLELQEEEPHNIAVDYYLKFKQARGRTAMSVVSSLIAKIGKYSLPAIKQMSQVDELHLREIADEKTALFIITPDDDRSKNFIASVFYMQLFQQLYDRAREEDDDRLPLHVQIYMDEFANIALPDDFDGIIATCRSRNIGICVILQGLSQLKKEYKEAWESITAQCSLFLYMGGMEQSTHEYVSKMLDKETININSFGFSRGRNGNYTKNDQLSGRELLTPGEVRLLKKNNAILLVQGEPPITDEMINTIKSKQFVKAKALGNFDHSKLDHDYVTTKVKPLFVEDSKYEAPTEINNIDFNEACNILAFSDSKK